MVKFKLHLTYPGSYGLAVGYDTLVTIDDSNTYDGIEVRMKTKIGEDIISKDFPLPMSKLRVNDFQSITKEWKQYVEDSIKLIGELTSK